MANKMEFISKIIKSEDELTEILIENKFNLLCQMSFLKMESNPKILLLTIIKLQEELKSLNIDKIYNLIKKEEKKIFEKFKNVKISWENNDECLIEIKSDDVINVFCDIFGINDLVIK